MNAKKNNLARKLAGLLAESWIMKAAKNVHERNADNWNLPVNEKILANMYCILRDYGNGQFPPVYTDRQAVYESESKYIRNEVVDPRQEFDATMRMPFELYVGNTNPGKLRNLVRLLAIVDRLKLEKGANVLEVGCGGGWLSEILCIKGFNVTATTLSQSDIELANLRSESLKVKKIDTTMRCIRAHGTSAGVFPGPSDAGWLRTMVFPL